ncbi:DNA-binding protein [Erwinia pyri]|uniref:DNA-binding protein n=1 Tax=Erwinia pyri TaxID=3062598 RepID=A0AA50DK42_9GAMM|nr:DNA-binding protein [Erwinia sp. DE2]WLS79499.1 DNA-binding protein [Erwinia sp. DE2]
MAKSVLHDDAMVQLIKDDPAFAPLYLHQAFIEIDEEGGYEAFMLALRHVIEATGGMTAIAKRAGMSRESLYKSLSPKGNPSFKRVAALASATGYPISRIATVNAHANA